MIYFTCDKPNSRSTGRRYTATLKWSNAHMPAGSTVAKLETTDRIRCTSSLHVVGVCAHSWDQQGECPKRLGPVRPVSWVAARVVCALCCVEAKERGVQVPRSRDDNRSR